MARLIYSMLTSLDGYIEDASGGFGWAAPDEELHTYINHLYSLVGTYLFGRRMYEMMIYWETAHTIPDQPRFVLDWARQWQAADKIVYSRTLTDTQSGRTRIEREFDPRAVRRLKAEAEHDLAVSGPELAADALKGGLVDELQLIVMPVIVGGGKPFFLEGVGADLELASERRFGSLAVFLQYAIRSRPSA